MQEQFENFYFRFLLQKQIRDWDNGRLKYRHFQQNGSAELKNDDPDCTVFRVPDSSSRHHFTKAENGSSLLSDCRELRFEKNRILSENRAKRANHGNGRKPNGGRRPDALLPVVFTGPFHNRDNPR